MRGFAKVAPMPASSLRATDEAPAKRPRGRPRKTVAERDDGNRRGELLRCAAKLFRRKGFDATSTRDIAAAVGMRSGSPFYHFKSKGALLFSVMQEGMQSAIARQQQALEAAQCNAPNIASRLRILIRNHFEILLGSGSDFIPVMLYEFRSIRAQQRRQLERLKDEYQQPWIPVLEALHASGQLKADVKLARLLIFGALNWSARWYDPRKAAGLDDLTEAAIDLFLGERI